MQLLNTVSVLLVCTLEHHTGSVLDIINLLRCRKTSALLSGFTADCYLEGFKELLQEKSLSVGVQIENQSSVFTVRPP